jgi:hypothetical protein
LRVKFFDYLKKCSLTLRWSQRRLSLFPFLSEGLKRSPNCPFSGAGLALHAARTTEKWLPIRREA